MKTLTILGITGSIGSNALRGLENYRDSIKLTAASVNSNVDKALAICLEWNIPNLCITSEVPCTEIPEGIKIWRNLEQMLKQTRADIVLNGISTSAGLMASVWAIESKSKLALANKETVVIGGKQFFDFVKSENGCVIPVDSEHSAIDELICTNGKDNIEKLIITASGGPFLNTPISELNNVTAFVAAKHPTWNMGPKISIDSSTLANKGLEVIEAHYLFGFDASNIEVVIHPQSIVHSMVRTVSGQVYAQMSPPDMVFPIMRAILERAFTKPVGKALDFSNLSLTFSKLDTKRFPFVEDAFECVRKEGIYPIVYTIADEMAVSAFMDGKIRFTEIHDIVRNALELSYNCSITSINDISGAMEEIKEKIKKSTASFNFGK